MMKNSYCSRTIHVYISFCLRSGTLKAEEVDDFEHPLLEKVGKIGINLYEPRKLTKADYCAQWVNEQIVSGRGRVECRTNLPCPPTYRKAINVLYSRRGGWRGVCRFNRYSSSTCIVGGCRPSPVVLDLVECCYKTSGNRRLIKGAKNGGGRSIPYQAWDNFFFSDNEIEAFKNCCHTQDYDRRSCNLFHSVRPICTSKGWRNRDLTWGK